MVSGSLVALCGIISVFDACLGERSMPDDIRTAVIAGGASILVGIITYVSTSHTVSAQLQTASLTHAHDISSAVHDAMGDLFNKDPRRVQTTLAGLYFLGAGDAERKQILETAAASRSEDVRTAISYLLKVDRTYGPGLAKDPDVVQLTSSQNDVTVPGTRNPTPAPISSLADTPKGNNANDALDQTISLLHGTGWVFLGLGPAAGDAIVVDTDSSIEQKGTIKTETAVKFVRTMNFRADPPEGDGLAQSIGTIQRGYSAVVLAVKAYPFRHEQHAVWAQVFLCDAPAAVERPKAASACPGSPQ
jgi:hypothetical protein